LLVMMLIRRRRRRSLLLPLPTPWSTLLSLHSFCFAYVDCQVTPKLHPFKLPFFGKFLTA
jgi:hypothetical protein